MAKQRLELKAIRYLLNLILFLELFVKQVFKVMVEQQQLEQLVVEALCYFKEGPLLIHLPKALSS